MTIYKLKSSAIRAAKKEFGEGWKEVASIMYVEDDNNAGFIIQTEVVKSIDPVAITKEVEVIEQLNAIDADVKAKKAKKAEIESRKPAFIPSTPIVEAVIEIPAPTPNPSLPAFLIPSPPSESIVPVHTDIDVEYMAKVEAGEDPIAQAQAAADKQANAQAVNIDPAKPRMSTIDRPTKKVWDIADKMPGAKRKDVIAECVRQGIAYGTARTQYQHWFKCLNDSIATPIATIGKDGKIVPPFPTK